MIKELEALTPVLSFSSLSLRVCLQRLDSLLNGYLQMPSAQVANDISEYRRVEHVAKYAWVHNIMDEITG